MTRAMVRMVLAAAVVCSTAVGTSAQTTSTSSETKNFEVLSVDGNTLVVRLPEGTRELTVADDFRFTVNGQQLSVQQLKAGMKGTATVTTKTTVTPVTVTEVKGGTVRHSMGTTIIVQTDEGYRSFTQGEIDKRGVKIMREGRAGAGLRLPPRRPDHRHDHHLEAAIGHDRAAGERHPRGGSPGRRRRRCGGSARGQDGSGVLLGGRIGSRRQDRHRDRRQRPARGAGAAGRTLPKTASSWPLVGLVSMLSLAVGLGLTLRRRLVG